MMPTTSTPQDTHKPRAGKLWRYLLAIIVVLALAEIGLRVATPETQFLDPDTDAYWKAQLRQQLARMPASEIRSDDIVHDPDLGWRMKPGYQTDGITHNSLGYRGKAEFTTAATRPRILLLGDSFTYGLGVNDAQTFGQVLKGITAAEVINTGVAAHSIDQSLLLWEHEGKAFKPKTVVLGYAVDKFFTNPLTVRNLPKPWFSKDAGTDRYTPQGIPVPDLATAQQQGLLHEAPSLRIVQAASWLARKIKPKLGLNDDLKQQAVLSDNLLGQLNESVTQSGAKLIVTFIGHCFDGEPKNLLAERKIIESCEKNGIQCIDIAAAMREGDFGSYYGDNCHWSAAGHRFAAEKIAASLQ